MRFHFLRCVAKAVVRNGVKLACGLVPGGGVVYDVAADAWEDYCQHGEKEALRKEIEALANASAEEVRQDVAAAVQVEAANQSQDDQQNLTNYLSQVPAAIRRSLRRPSDPIGLTVPVTLPLSRSEDLVSLLPSRLPRFKPGDQPEGIGDWELEELLGVGGFGEVWKARNPYLTERAALKFCVHPDAPKLLEHEANMLSRVARDGKHPGIVRLRNTYIKAKPPCLEYEYVEGEELGVMVRESHGGLPPVEAARVVRDLAEIVGFAHRRTPPIVHRDLKPANILVQRQKDRTLTFRVTDFGIGRVVAEQAIACTAVSGAYTPLYASPQQMKGLPPDCRDDVYALGVIWYQLLTGDLAAGRPGGGGWRKRLAERKMVEPLIALLESCIEDNPGDRPADAADLTDWLNGLLEPVPPPPWPIDAKLQAENQRRWLETPEAREWIEKRGGDWDHRAWLAVVERVRNSRFWPLNEATLEEVLKKLVREAVEPHRTLPAHDPWGNHRQGSESYAVNMAYSQTSQENPSGFTLEDVAKRTPSYRRTCDKNRVKAHLKHWIERASKIGLYVDVKDGLLLMLKEQRKVEDDPSKRDACLAPILAALKMM